MRQEAAGHVATAAMTGVRGLWPFDTSQSAKGRMTTMTPA
jgi:hypothetical protein